MNGAVFFHTHVHAAQKFDHLPFKFDALDYDISFL